MTNETYIIDTSTGNAMIVKDPQATLDYSFDWTTYLALISDTLQSATFSLSSGTLVTSGFSNGVATAWLSGGTIGTTIILICHIVTAGGRTDERSIFIKVKNR